MALTPDAISVEVNDLATRYPFLSLHSANPGLTGVNETTAPRLPANWVFSGTEASAIDRAFTGGSPNGACTFVGLWSLREGGTFGGSGALIGDQTFDPSGNYTVSLLTIPGSST